VQMDFSLTTFKDHLRVHCKPAYQRQNKDHYKDNLLTDMQVFGNANGLFPWNKFRVQKPFKKHCTPAYLWNVL